MVSDQLPVQREVLSVREVAVYLGISESTVRAMIRANEIPYLRLRRRYLFYLQRINQWLMDSSIKPGEQQDDPVRLRSKEILRSLNSPK
jgi:excisionase family DNA binding protein